MYGVSFEEMLKASESDVTAFLTEKNSTEGRYLIISLKIWRYYNEKY